VPGASLPTVTDPYDAATGQPADDMCVLRTADAGGVLRGVSFTPGSR
jgi:hypothetical protein